MLPCCVDVHFHPLCFKSTLPLPRTAIDELYPSNLNYELFQITEKLAYDHNPHDLFVEMDELRGDEWVEQARYTKTDLQYYINATSLLMDPPILMRTSNTPCLRCNKNDRSFQVDQVRGGPRGRGREVGKGAYLVALLPRAHQPQALLGKG